MTKNIHTYIPFTLAFYFHLKADEQMGNVKAHEVKQVKSFKSVQFGRDDLGPSCQPPQPIADVSGPMYCTVTVMRRFSSVRKSVHLRGGKVHRVFID